MDMETCTGTMQKCEHYVHVPCRNVRGLKNVAMGGGGGGGGVEELLYVSREGWWGGGLQECT